MRHIRTDRTKFKNKSKFANPSQWERLAEDTVSNADKFSPADKGRRLIFEKDFGKITGSKPSQTGIRVVLEADGTLVTAYPSKGFGINVPLAGLGASIASLTGVELLGDVVDFFNPMSDLQDIIELLDEVVQLAIDCF